ncbi:MAG: FAD-dependent oxidoreductase [Actinobacteria bacterium]|nr:FAD-dependent oxidoreductase [Actinomycetota bacterium]
MPVRFVDRPPSSVDVCIVGGGVVGAATAFYAARAGLRPVIVEKRPALATLTTAASTGAFRLQFDNKEELDLISESVELFFNFQDGTGQSEHDLGLRPQGYLWLTTDEERARRQKELVALQHSWGLTDVELLEGDEVRERWPYVGHDVVQARFRAADGFLDPKALTYGMAVGSRAEVLAGTEATGFLRSGDRVTGVSTTRGDLSAGLTVIACGPLSGVVAGHAGVELPVETVARHKVVMAEVPEVPSHAPMTIDDDTGAHWRPALAGAYLLYTDPATPPSEPVDNVVPDHGLAFDLLKPEGPVSVSRVAPFWRRVWERGTAHWTMQSGHYTMTPDHRPLLGPLGPEGLFVNSGYSGHGIMGSAAGSRHLIDVVTGAIAGPDNTFRPDRAFEPRDLDLL